MVNLIKIIKEAYNKLTDTYIDEKGCKERYYNGRNCEYKHDCHYKFLFHDNIYCLNKELGKQEDLKNKEVQCFKEDYHD